MKEIKYIMTTMTNNSLVIIDELCRSTSLEEGTALAIAVVEHLAQYSAFIYITTHFTLLTKLQDMYLNVKVWQLETIPSGDDPKTFKLDFRHALKPGVTSVRHYGVYIVRNIWPDSILRYVDELLDNISKKPKDPKIVSLDAKLRLKYKVESQFRRLKSQRKLTVSEINKLLNQYHDELEKMGHRPGSITFYPSRKEEPMRETAMLEHSIFGDIDIQNYSEEEDARMGQYFTPMSLPSSQMSSDLETHRQENLVRRVFTPEVAQDEYLNQENLARGIFTPGVPQKEYLNQENLPREIFTQGDVYLNQENLVRRIFTPEAPQEEYVNQESLIRRVFTPELSQEEYLNGSYPNLGFYTNLQDGNCYDNFQRDYENGTPNNSYLNISRFLAEDSENVHKLVPEVNVSYEDMYDVDQNSFYNKQTLDNFQRHGGTAESNHSKRSSSLDDFRFSVPLQNDAGKTSTPIRPKENALLKSASPAVYIYSGRNFSTTANTINELEVQEETKDLDLESIREDLEICSRILTEEDADFEENYESVQESQTENTGEEPVKEKFEHVMAVVEVIEGPNNTTLSFDEDDFEDLPENQWEQKEEQVVEAVPNKINIISDVLIAPGKVKTVEKEDEEMDNEGEHKEQSFKLQTITMDQPVEENYADNGLNQNEANENVSLSTIENSPYKNTSQTHEKKSYKSFDSTYEAARTNTDNESPLTRHLNDSFKSVVKEDDNSFKSCLYEGELNQDNLVEGKSNCVSSGYEISLMEDPKRFLTSSAEKTTNKESSAEKRNEMDCSGKLEDKTEATGISFASRVRNLDEPDPSGSTSQENSDTKKTVTSISSVSRKRNLDQATSDSTSAIEKSQEKSETSSSLKESDEKKSNSRWLKRKFSAPRTKDGQEEYISSDPREKRKKKLKKPATKKFVPPRKLSNREIREEFEKQDRKILEDSAISSDLSKYLEQLVNRPTVKQIRNSTHLATVRKTEHGVEVIHNKPPKKKFEKIHRLKKHSSVENFDMTIFSDKNALSFGNYLNSSEKDYRTFTFNFNRGQEGQRMEFAPTTFSFGEYTNKSVTERLVRTVSETSCGRQVKHVSGEGNIVGNVPFKLQKSAGYTLTPEGFFKQNKDDITRIMNKYLEETTREIKSTNIFESEIDPSILNI